MNDTLVYESLEERIAVHTYDGYFMALCPFHEKNTGRPDHRPSFMVTRDHGFHCMGSECGAHGSLEYLDKYLGGSMYDPARALAERVYPVLPKWRKWIDKYGDVEGIARGAHALYCRNPDLRSFFVKRGIHQFYQMGLFGWLDWWNLFPVFDQAGRVTDIVARADKGKGDAKYVLVKKSEEHTVPPVYVPDWNLFMQSKVVYIVYGIIDSWAIRSLGLASLSGTTGKSLSAKSLYRFGKQWVIVPDAREEKEAWELKFDLGSSAQVKVLDYPFKSKDPDNVLRKHGPAYLSHLLGVEHGNCPA